MRILAEKPIFADRIGLYAVDKSNDGKSYVAAVQLVMEETSAGYMPPSFTSLSIEEAQRLMDSLWDCGLRPTEGAGSAGALAATQYHLEDMRKLVFERRIDGDQK